MPSPRWPGVGCSHRWCSCFTPGSCTRAATCSRFGFSGTRSRIGWATCVSRRSASGGRGVLGRPSSTVALTPRCQRSVQRDWSPRSSRRISRSGRGPASWSSCPCRCSPISIEIPAAIVPGFWLLLQVLGASRGGGVAERRTRAVGDGRWSGDRRRSSARCWREAGRTGGTKTKVPTVNAR